jgi:hypothetical protein
MRGEANPTLVIWDGINNHGMYNTRVESKNKTEISGSLTVEQALQQAMEEDSK